MRTEAISSLNVCRSRVSGGEQELLVNSQRIPPPSWGKTLWARTWKGLTGTGSCTSCCNGSLGIPRQDMKRRFARCDQLAHLEALRNESSNADFKPPKHHRPVRIHGVNEDCTAVPKERLVPTEWAMPLAMSRLLAVCPTLCELRSRVL